MTNQVGVALSTLAADTGILLAGPTMLRGGRLISVRGMTNIRSLTAGDGPLMFGISDKALSLTELEEYLELDGPVSPNVRTPSEIASRGAIVRTLGMIEPQGVGTTGGLYLNNVSLSGLKISEEAAGWNYWVYNAGKTMTTGATWVCSFQFFVEFNPSG